MKEYRIKITERLSKVITVKANSKQEALDGTIERVNSDELNLDPVKHFVGVDVTSVDVKPVWA